MPEANLGVREGNAEGEATSRVGPHDMVHAPEDLHRILIRTLVLADLKTRSTHI